MFKKTNISILLIADAAEGNVAVAEEEQSTDIENPIDIAGQNFVLIETEIKKGRGKGNVAYYLKATEEGFIDKVRKAVGEENFIREIYGMIRERCADATHDAKAKAKDGIFTDTAWISMFLEQWLPGARRAGSGKKQLLEKQKLILSELNPLIMRQCNGEKLPEEVQNRMLTLIVEYGEVNEKLENTARKGKKNSQ